MGCRRVRAVSVCAATLRDAVRTTASSLSARTAGEKRAARISRASGAFAALNLGRATQAGTIFR